MAAMWARVGMKCVWVGIAGPWYDEMPEAPPPAPGHVCTISALDPDANGAMYIVIDGQYQVSWDHLEAFRPLIQRTAEQDAALFAPFLLQHDPIITADVYEQSLADAEALLNMRWVK